MVSHEYDMTEDDHRNRTFEDVLVELDFPEKIRDDDVLGNRMIEEQINTLVAARESIIHLIDEKLIPLRENEEYALHSITGRLDARIDNLRNEIQHEGY